MSPIAKVHRGSGQGRGGGVGGRGDAIRHLSGGEGGSERQAREVVADGEVRRVEGKRRMLVKGRKRRLGRGVAPPFGKDIWPIGNFIR